MIFPLVLVGSGIALWRMKRKQRQRRALRGPDPGPKAPPGSTSAPSKPLRPLEILRDLRRVIGDEERAQLQLDMDPAQRQALAAARAQNRRNTRLSLAALGVTGVASLVPALRVIGILSVLLLNRDLYTLVLRDLKRGRLFSVYLFSLVMILGIIATGHLMLAAFSSVMANFFAGVVNRVENDSQRQLISVFSGHPERVWVLCDGVEMQVDFHRLHAGDIVVVNAGEVIPADGLVQQGEGQVDQHLLTGESRPVEKAAGDQVFASTLLISGRLEIGVVSAGTTTMAARIGEVLNHTQSYKDTMMSRGRTISDRFLPVNLGLAGLTLPLLGSNAALAMMFSSLGGTMGSSGSLTVLTYLQLLSRLTVLIKDGRVLESLRQVDTVVFDKTGTLTLEQPMVAAVHALTGFDQAAVLRAAAAAEFRQPHPIARAVVEEARARGIALPDLDQAEYTVGYGIRVATEGRVIRVGSARFLTREGLVLPAAAECLQGPAEDAGHSLVYVGVDDRVAGVLELAPSLRPEVQAVVDRLKGRGIRCCILSGDQVAPTRATAQRLGIEEYFAEVLPEHKAAHIARLKAEGRFVCFVGDGINDAVALKTAQVSVSIRGASTAATDTAQVILMDGTLSHLPLVFEAADEFEKTMRRNLLISFAPGTVIIGGVYLVHLSVAAAMGIFYLGCFAAIGNVLWPLVKHRQELGEDPPTAGPEAMPTDEPNEGDVSGARIAEPPSVPSMAARPAERRTNEHKQREFT